MGCRQSSLLSSCYQNEDKVGNAISYAVALKLPHGLSYLEYMHDSGSFQKVENLDDWISKQFHRTKPFHHYINYNDE